MSSRFDRTVLPSLTQTALIQLSAVLLLAAFWVTLRIGSDGALVTGVRAVIGLALVLFVPGVLITRLARLDSSRLSEFVLYGVGLSLAFLSVFVVAVSGIASVANVAEPFSLQPLAVSLTVVLLVMSSLLWINDTPPLRLQRMTLPPLTIGLVALPVVAILAAASMSNFENASLMFVFVGLVVVAVFLSCTRYVSPRHYAIFVFFIALATFLHRNLLTAGAIGADVQFQYFLAQRIQELHVWTPGTESQITALPLVTSVPATVSILSGVPVAGVFKTVHVFVLSLVPVGIYYVGKDIFGSREAFFGSLFFIFYHTTFSITPGKQLLSEIFVVLLVLLFYKGGLSTLGGKAVAILLTIGVVHAHYGLAFVFGGSLLVGTLTLSAVRIFVDDFDHDVPLTYPVTFLGITVGWYWASAPELLNRVARTPISIGQQLSTLLTGTAVGSGASYIYEQVTLLDQLNVAVYFALTALLGLGLVSRISAHWLRVRRGEPTRYVEYTALSIPMFAFLASTFFVTANLWADRSYQMVLLVLAPFVGLGFRSLFVATVTFLDRVGEPTNLRPRWSLLAVLLCVLFLLNSGAAFAATGNADTATFDSNANDFVFTDNERDAALWLKEHAELSGSGSFTGVSTDSSSEDTVTIYTDSVSYQLLRSVVPENYYDVQVVRLRSPWHPEFDQRRIDSGYVFIRERSVKEAPSSQQLPVTSLSREHANEIIESGTVVFRNEDVTIVRVGDQSDV